jgi:hypothetical protein
MLLNSLDSYQMIFVDAKYLNILSCSYHPCLVAGSGLRYMLCGAFVLVFFSSCVTCAASFSGVSVFYRSFGIL